MEFDTMLLKNTISAIAERRKEETITKLAGWVAYNFDGVKYIVSHRNDPPWDCSGELVNTGEGFNESDYNKVEDFLEEYNGNSRATYISGMGFSHEQYSDDLSYYIQEEIIPCICIDAISFLRKNHRSYLEGLINELNIKLEDMEDCLDYSSDDKKIVENIFFSDIIGDFLWFEFELTIIKWISELPMKDALSRGEFLAKKLKERDRLEAERREAEAKARKTRAAETWAKITKLYLEVTGVELPGYVDKNSPHYPWFWRVITYSDIPEDVIRELGVEISNSYNKKLSNKITTELCKINKEKEKAKLMKKNTLPLPLAINKTTRLTTAEIAKDIPIPVGVVGDAMERDKRK